MNLDRKYCFSHEEFIVLAGSLGVQSFYGFKPKEAVNISEKDLYQILFKMTEKGFLEVVQDGFLVVQQIREIFLNLKETDRVIVIYSVEDRFPEKCVYVGKGNVLVEAGGLQGKYFKCSNEDAQKIWKIACDSSVLLKQNVADDILYNNIPVTKDILEDEELKQLIDLLEKYQGKEDKEKLKAYGVHAVMEKRNVKNALLQEQIFLISRPIYDVILLQTEEEVTVFYYSGQLLFEMLDKWTGGNIG